MIFNDTIFTSSVTVTILTMGRMSILRQSSPWWPESTSMFMGQWMKMAFMKVWPVWIFLIPNLNQIQLYAAVFFFTIY